MAEPTLAASPPRHAAAQLAALSPAILLLRNSGRVEIGSSTLVRVGERFLLATAAHNLDDARDEEIRLVPAGHPADEPLPMLRRSARRRRDDDDPRDPADVAWVEIHAEVVASRGLGVVELDGLGGGPAAAEECVLLAGYPAERVLAAAWCDDGFSLHRLGNVEPMGFVTRRVAGRPDEVVALYPPEVVDAETGGDGAPHPHGISGGPVWGCPLEAAASGWQSSSGRSLAALGLRLLGIVRGWRRYSRTLHATPIEQWLLRVAWERPDLRPAVAAVLD